MEESEGESEGGRVSEDDVAEGQRGDGQGEGAEEGKRSLCCTRDLQGAEEEEKNGLAIMWDAR